MPSDKSKKSCKKRLTSLITTLLLAVAIFLGLKYGLPYAKDIPALKTLGLDNNNNDSNNLTITRISSPITEAPVTRHPKDVTLDGPPSNLDKHLKAMDKMVESIRKLDPDTKIKSPLEYMSSSSAGIESKLGSMTSTLEKVKSSLKL